MILVTTSRKPGQSTRTFSKRLALLIPNAVYDSRGKKGVADLLEQAKSAGLRRILVVCELHGVPAELRFMDSGGNWQEILQIKKATVSTERIPQDAIKIEGEQKKIAERLFALESDDDGEIILTAGHDFFEFKSGEKTILKFTVVKDGRDN